MIRQASQADLSAIQKCAALAYEKYVERIGQKPAPMVADFGKLIEEQCVQVYDNGSIAGFIVLYPKDDHLHVENVAVHPVHRGCGIGKRLLTFAEETARQHGYAAVELYTNEKMTENLSFYPQQGYVEVDRRQEDGFNRVYFRKKL